jgi:hypothetical protein
MRNLVRGLMACAGLICFACHNLRDTFTNLVTKESGDLTSGIALIKDKVSGVRHSTGKRPCRPIRAVLTAAPRSRESRPSG